MTILVITSGLLVERRLWSAHQRKRGRAAKPIRVLPFLNERRASLSQIIIFDFRTFLFKTNGHRQNSGQTCPSSVHLQPKMERFFI